MISPREIAARVVSVWRGRARRPIAFGCLGLVVGGVAVTGLALTPPQVQPHLLAGTIWLTSRTVGQLTLVNGVSAEVSAAVSVTGPNGRFTTEQSGSDGYAVTPATGAIVDVHDSTLQKTATTLANASESVQVASGTLFAVDRSERLVQVIASDPLAPVGRAVPLPGRGAAVVAVGNTLWAADGPSGSLVTYRDRNGKPVRRRTSAPFPATKGEPRFTAANGVPVLVDPSGRTAFLLDPTGAVTRTMQVELRGVDELTGAVDSDTLDIVQPDRGLLTVCNFGTRACLPSFPLTGMNHRLGPAVQVAGHVFVPDYTTGVVRVADIATRRTVGTERLFNHLFDFELRQNDHIVYFNDPDSEQAGVIDPDGTIHRLSKYDRLHPNGTPVTPGPHTTRSGPPVPTTTPLPTGNGHPLPGPASGPAAVGGTRPATTAPTAPGPHIVDIVANPVTPEARIPVAFSADVTGSPTVWAWTVTKSDGTTEASAGTPRFDHVFATPGVYDVRLVVRAGSLRDEQSLRLTVVPFTPPVHCGDTVTTNVVLTADLRCTGTALTIGASDITVDLNGHTVSSPGPASHGSDHAIVSSNQDGFTVEDGSIVGGLHVSFASFVTISRLHVDDIQLDIVQDSRIGQSTLGGMDDSGGVNNSMIGNSVMGGTMLLDPASRDFISGDRFSSASIFFNVDSINNTVANNMFVHGGAGMLQANDQTFTGNTFDQSGIEVHQSDQIAIQGNRFLDSGVAIRMFDQGLEDNIVDGNIFDGNLIGVEVQADGVITFSGSRITNNTFTNNGDVGAYLVLDSFGAEQPAVISGNTFVGNGRHSDGMVDDHGHAVNDGLHVDAPAGTTLQISDNHTRNNADYGIEAQPGTVLDGGGNTSQGDPSGCLGVRCG